MNIAIFLFLAKQPLCARGTKIDPFWSEIPGDIDFDHYGLKWLSLVHSEQPLGSILSCFFCYQCHLTLAMCDLNGTGDLKPLSMPDSPL